MRDPAGKVKDDSCLIQIQRVINKCIRMKIVPHVIQGHNYHDKTLSKSMDLIRLVVNGFIYWGMAGLAK
jgi:hypothetical protein